MDGERISTREWVDKAFPLVFYRFGGVPLAAPMEIAPKNYAAVVAGRPKTDRRVCNILDFEETKV